MMSCRLGSGERERRGYTILGVALALSVSAGDVAAQRTQTHTGATLAFGVGRGTLRLDCDGCENGRSADLSAMARFGWTVNESFFVAGELMGFQHATLDDLETVSVTSYWVGAVALWYPRKYAEGHFKLGAGFSGNNGPFAFAGRGTVDVTLNRPGVLAGVGADLRIGRTFSLTPFVDFIFILPAEQRLTGGQAPLRIGGNVLNFGIALVQH